MSAPAVLGLVAGWGFRPDRAIQTATATIAHDLCSTTFVTGADPERFYTDNLRPRLVFGLLAPAVRYAI